MLRTKICDMLGIEHPIILAGMDQISKAELAAAVSNAGGLGVLGAAFMSPENIRAEIRKLKDMTDRPFGVDLIFPYPGFATKQLEVLYEEDVKILVSGLGIPEEAIPEARKRNMVVMSLAGRVRHAVRAEQVGVNIIAAQGTDAGGHTGKIGTMSLVPQVVDAVSVPVLAAGGIGDGRGLVAALALGAQGVMMGTRFVASHEADAHDNYKGRILEVSADQAVITRCYTGKTMRAIRNEYVDMWATKEDEILAFPQQAIQTAEQGLGDVTKGDVKRGCMPAGQVSGMLTELKSGGDIVKEVVEEAEAILARGVVPQ